MIGKLVGILISLALAACVATVIAEAILTVYYVRTWNLTSDKLAQMLAVARGAEGSTASESSPAQARDASVEQPSYSQVLAVRAVKVRDIELREQALRGGIQQLQSDLQKLADEKKRLQQARVGFQDELAVVQKTAASGGIDDTRRTLETIKPKQAKELLAQMIERNETDQVVLLVQGMSDSRRAKIIAEFKTPAEVEQIGEVLRRIRQGEPVAAVPDKAKTQLEPPQRPAAQ